MSQKGDYLELDNQQAASILRLGLQGGLNGCQYENGRMRWWLPQGLLLELVDSSGPNVWRLSVVKPRERTLDPDPFDG